MMRAAWFVIAAWLSACVTLTAADHAAIALDATRIASCQAVGRACKADGGKDCYAQYDACMRDGGLR